jgi:hypothetical protein
MAPDRGDGDGVQAHELSANAKRDLREVLCGAELPAQWQKYPLKTQQELMRGRDSLADHALWKWADEGEKWLYEQFKGKGLEFHTGVDFDNRKIQLTVFTVLDNGKAKEAFSISEPAESFVSHLTVTKIILIAG